MAVKHLTPGELNQRRRKAVELRLAGETLASVAAQSGLSVPTVVAAFKAFKAGGWAAVSVRARGRALGEQRLMSPSQEADLWQAICAPEPVECWSLARVIQWAGQQGVSLTDRSARRVLERLQLSTTPLVIDEATPKSAALRRWLGGEFETLGSWVRRLDGRLLWAGCRVLASSAGRPSVYQFYWHDQRGRMYWICSERPFDAAEVAHCLTLMCRQQSGAVLGVVLQGLAWYLQPALKEWLARSREGLRVVSYPNVSRPRRKSTARAHNSNSQQDLTNTSGKKMALTHLQRLEAESIHIMREVVAEADNPVMLYSIGKDSAVMLHLAMKAFAPSVPPFPLLHVDTRWKFREMYSFRDRMAQELGMDLLVHINPEAVEKDINPFTHGSAIHTDITKTEGLKQALDKYGFDAAFGGARRDEEKSRAKERIFSFRTAQHRWDPKNQRPELWKQYNTRKHKGESIRVFPLSNWTELDIWQYIYLENIPIVPLYYAAERPVVERDGALIMVDDERMPLKPGEVPMMRKVRFRTLGCYPLTGAVESEADTLPAIIQEMLLTKTSERQGRVIDHDSAASMEKKKQEGYF